MSSKLKVLIVEPSSIIVEDYLNIEWNRAVHILPSLPDVHICKTVICTDRIF